jgi:hypothetical protein
MKSREGPVLLPDLFFCVFKRAKRERRCVKMVDQRRTGIVKAVRMVVVCALVFMPGLLIAAEHFDGKWLTTLTCPAKGNTEGYTWKIPSVIENGNFKAERGTAGEPGYLLIEGPIKEDGSAKLSANGVVARRIQLRRQGAIQRDNGYGHQGPGSGHRRAYLYIRLREAVRLSSPRAWTRQAERGGLPGGYVCPQWLNPQASEAGEARFAVLRFLLAIGADFPYHCFTRGTQCGGPPHFSPPSLCLSCRCR